MSQGEPQHDPGMLEHTFEFIPDTSYYHNPTQPSSTILLCRPYISYGRSQGRPKVSKSKAQRRTCGSTTIRVVPPQLYSAL